MKNFVRFCVRLAISHKGLLAFALGEALAIALAASTAYAAQGGVEEGSQASAVSEPSASQSQEVNASPYTTATLDAARNKIQHVVVIMQENRSFDHYFGTYPGADGIPMQEDGVPNVCVPKPEADTCVKPFHDTNDKNAGGPHGAKNATADIDDGKMDGFIGEAQKGRQRSCKDPNDPDCGGSEGVPDAIGYHDAREIPNYWNYAEQFVLQDHMFEPNASWSLPEHLFMVSEWSAKCSEAGDPMSCQNELQSPDRIQKGKTTTASGNAQPDYAWTDLTYLLHNDDVS